MAEEDGWNIFELLAQAIEGERLAQERYLRAALLAGTGERLTETFSRLAEQGARREAELRLRLAELSLEQVMSLSPAHHP